MNFEEFKSHLLIPKYINSEDMLREYIYFLKYIISKQTSEIDFLFEKILEVDSIFEEIDEEILGSVAYDHKKLIDQFDKYYDDFLKQRKENEL